MNILHTTRGNDTFPTPLGTSELGSKTPPTPIYELMAALAALPGCAGAFMYAQQGQRGKLSLRIAVPSTWTGCQREYEFGEGAVGIAALRRKPARSSRHSYALPILSHDGRLLGVLALAVRSSRALSHTTMLVASNVARLLADALQCEEVRETVRKQACLMDAIELLARDPSLDLGDHEIFDSIVGLGRQMMRAGACALYLRERHQNNLHLAAVSPSPSALPAVYPDRLWRTSSQNGTTADSQMRQRAVLRGVGRLGGQRARAFIASPIMVETSPAGILLMQDDALRAFNQEDLTVAERLAQLVGLVLRHRRLCDLATDRARPDAVLWETLDPVSGGDAARTLVRARRLGHNLLRPHVVFFADAAGRAEIDRLHQSILELDSNSLVDIMDMNLVAILAPERLAGLSADGLTAGVSRPCADLARFPIAYREAREALEIGTRLFGRGRVTRIDELESYRFVPMFMQSGLTDNATYQVVARLPNDLLKTLETYLDTGGNATRAAKQLFLHRNTLRQRLDRISALIEMDLTASERWLPLQLAVKAARLTRLESAATEPLPASPASMAFRGGGRRTLVSGLPSESAVAP